MSYPDPRPWIRCDGRPPERGVLVDTKVDDEHGVRHEQPMSLRGNLWFTEDGLYVYYAPTHWRERA